MEQKQIIKNPIILQPDTNVFLDDDLIVVRKEQIKELFQMLNPSTQLEPPFEVKYKGQPLKYIWGWKGTGKTTMLKWFKTKVEVSLGIKVIYINCRNYPTSSTLLDEILKRLQNMFPDTVLKQIGVRPQISEMVSLIKDKQVFLFLDEIDKPLNNSKTVQKDQFLHYIIRLVSETDHHTFKIVFTTNIYNIESKLSEEVLSFLGRKKIHFGVYPVPEIVEILEKRCIKALMPGTYSKQDLQLIGHLTTNQYDGDIRTAISLLSDLADISHNKLDSSLLSTVLRELDFEVLKKEVNTYPKGVQLLLAAIIDDIDKKGGIDVPKDKKEHIYYKTDELNNLYVNFCEREQYPVTKRSAFYNYFGALTGAGMLKKTIKGYKIDEDLNNLKKSLNAIL